MPSKKGFKLKSAAKKVASSVISVKKPKFTTNVLKKTRSQKQNAFLAIKRAKAAGFRI